MNSCDSTPPTWTQTSEQEYNDLTASSTILPQHSSKLFTRNPVICFLEVGNACVDVLCILPRLLKNLLGSENVVCSSTAGTKSTLGIIQLWFNHFVASSFKTVNIYFSWKAMERCFGSWRIHTCVLFGLYRDFTCRGPTFPTF